MTKKIPKWLKNQIGKMKKNEIVRSYDNYNIALSSASFYHKIGKQPTKPFPVIHPKIGKIWAIKLKKVV
jgi:hypothetical protein